MALKCIGELETVVSEQQQQLKELVPLQRDMVAAHLALCNQQDSVARDLQELRKAHASLQEKVLRDFEELREAHEGVEERVYADIVTLGDNVKALERCAEENDGRLNEVLTNGLQGRLEAGVALDEQLKALEGHLAERSSQLCEGHLAPLVEASAMLRGRLDDIVGECDEHRSMADGHQVLLEELQARVAAENAAMLQRLGALEHRFEKVDRSSGGQPSLQRQLPSKDTTCCGDMFTTNDFGEETPPPRPKVWHGTGLQLNAWLPDGLTQREHARDCAARRIPIDPSPSFDGDA